MNLETKITIYKFTPQLFTLTRDLRSNRTDELAFINKCITNHCISINLFLIRFVLNGKDNLYK